MLDLDNLLETIEQTETKKRDKENHKSDENFLSFKAGNTYHVRLLPYIADPSNTFVDYEEYGWNSCIPGQGYIYAGRTPKSLGKDDLVARLQWQTFQEGRDTKDDGKKTRSYKLLPQKKQMVNVYVIDDPANPENNGTVKVLRYSSRLNKDGTPTGHLHKVIQNGIFGDDREDVGKRAFDLTKNGCTLRVKVTQNAGGWNDYAESKFVGAKDLGLSKPEIEGIYDQAKDLTTLIPDVKSESELRSLLDLHWHGKNASHDAELDQYDDDGDELDLSPRQVKGSDAEDDMDKFLDGLGGIDD